MRICLYAIAVLALTASPLWANPPSDIQLTYDQEAQSLQIRITHFTTKPRKDFIKGIVVRRNNEKPQTILRHWQENRTTASEKIDLPVESGDVLEVEASCSDGGKKTARLTIP